MIYSKRHKVSIAKLSMPKSKRDVITMRKIPVPEELVQNIPSVQLAVSKLKDFASYKKPVMALNPDLEKLNFSISKYLNDLREMEALDLVSSKDFRQAPAGVIAQEVSTVLPELLGTQATTAWNLGPDLLTMIRSSSYDRVPDNDRSC